MKETDKIRRRGVVLQFTPPARECCVLSNVVDLCQVSRPAFPPVMTCVEHLEIFQAQLESDLLRAHREAAPPWVRDNLAYYARWLDEFIAAIP